MQMAKINDLPLLSNPTEDMYCLVGKDDLKKVPWSAIMGQIGSPYIATTVASMTDKTRVYVYQGSESGYTSGNWYYWNGSAWTSGGKYNSAAVETDKTLTVADKAADSAVVGQQISSLKKSKISKPSIDGTPGQVLTKDKTGEFVWQDVLTELDDNSVDLSKLKHEYLLEKTGAKIQEIWDEDAIIYRMSQDDNLTNGYLSQSSANDNIIATNNDYTSSFVQVKPNSTYYMNRWDNNGNQGLKMYNSEKKPISFTKKTVCSYIEDMETQSKIVTPDNCYFIRIDSVKSLVDVAFIANRYPKKLISDKRYYINANYIKKGDSSEIPFDTIIWKANENKLEYGYIRFQDGVAYRTNEGNADRLSLFIPVKPNTRYAKNPNGSCTTNKQDVAFFDSTKTFISGIQLQINEYEFVTPENCAFVRIDLLKSYIDTEYLQLVNDSSDDSDNTIVSDKKSLPTLYMSGDVTDMSKVNEKFVRFKYIDGTTIKRGYNAIKWQGDSSLSYPKKNYTIKLYCDKNKKCKQSLDFGWGKQNKYVLKANYIDHSHARNIVSARLWSQIVNSRGTYSYTNVKDTPNNGAIDGMPIIVYLNDTYLGLYTLNIPKDKWMFGMDDKISTQAVIGSENYVEGCFRTSSNPLNGWSAEFPDELPTEIQTSFKTAYNFVTNNTGADFKSGLSNYFDVASLIDYYIFGYVICHLDGFGKNQLLATYDGIHWSMMAYDMDSTFGLYWNGSKFVSTDYRCQEDYQSVVDGPSGTNGNELFNKLKDNFKTEIYERYTELREDVLSLDNIKFEFEKFMNSITSKDYLNDIKTNTGVPQKNVDHLKQIEEYIEARLPYVDTKMGELNS